MGMNFKRSWVKRTAAAAIQKWWWRERNIPSWCIAAAAGAAQAHKFDRFTAFPESSRRSRLLMTARNASRQQQKQRDWFQNATQTSFHDEFTGLLLLSSTLLLLTADAVRARVKIKTSRVRGMGKFHSSWPRWENFENGVGGGKKKKCCCSVSHFPSVAEWGPNSK